MPSIRSLGVLHGALAVLLVAAPAAAGATLTTRVSVDSAGAEANGKSSFAAISGDGRVVAFDSEATNLVAGDTNARRDVFVHDRQRGLTLRVGSNSGAQPNGDSFTADISGDGRYVVFTSLASNLVAGDTNGIADVFVRDRVAATTTRVSVSSAGAQAASGFSGSPAISSDGRYVVFDSTATNLVGDDRNSRSDVFVRDRTAGTTTRVSLSSGGSQGNGDSDQPDVSGNGRFVAFRSAATGLVSGDTNGARDVFLRDLAAGLTTRVNLAGSATQTAGGESPALGDDGRYVAFTTIASNVVSGDTNGKPDIFLRDRSTASTTRISVSSTGAQANEFSFFSAMSGDGRFVAFDARASNLIAGASDTNGGTDVFLRDRLTGTTTLVSGTPAGGFPAHGSALGGISADGRLVAFTSGATNLVAGDMNGRSDVFVLDRFPAIPATVSYSGSAGLSIVDGANDPGSFAVHLFGGSYTVTPLGLDTARPLTLGPGCAFDGGEARCNVTGVPVVSVQLGDGDDRFEEPGCVFTMADAAVSGGPGADVLVGGPGFDLLKGDDGDDTLRGCAGNDRLDGGAGLDVFKLGIPDTGADVVVGGTGVDKVEYEASTPITVSLDGLAGDGPAGEGDNVGSDVENVSTGEGDDQLTGSGSGNTFTTGAGADRLIGAGGRDVLEGGADADQLSGLADNDVLDGGLGVDQLLGGDADDLLLARDGEADAAIDCGNGVDTANVDLRDVPDSSCENLDQGAIREGPHVVLGVRRALRLRAGRLAVPVFCPRKLKHACRGRLTAAPTRNRLRRSARTRYEVPRGRRRTVLVRVGPAVRRGRRVFVQSVERGDTRGNKTTRRVARIASSRR